MGFKSLFKVRKPGNGDSVQKGFEATSKRSKGVKFPSKDNSQNSGGKTAV